VIDGMARMREEFKGSLNVLVSLMRTNRGEAGLIAGVYHWLHLDGVYLTTPPPLLTASDH
jgi:hypothetical protein